MEVYVKKLNADGSEVLDDAGKPVLEAVSTDTLDIKEHPQAKKLLEEAIKYRKQLAAAKKAASEEGETSGDDAPAKKPAATEGTPAEVPHIPTVEEMVDALEKRQAERQVIADKQATEWATKVDAAMLKHKLAPHFRNVVDMSRDPEAMAASLAKNSLQFATAPSGGKSDEDEIADMWKNIDADLFGDDPKK